MVVGLKQVARLNLTRVPGLLLHDCTRQSQDSNYILFYHERWVSSLTNPIAPPRYLMRDVLY